MKRSYLLVPTAFAVALFSAAAPAKAELVDEIVGVVNREVILKTQVDEVLALVEASELASLTGEARVQRQAELEREILEGLVDEELIEQAMDRAAVHVDDREVEAAIADVARRNRMTVEQLFAQIGYQGMTKGEYRSETKKQIRRHKFLSMEIGKRVDITEEELKSRYNLQVAEAAPDPAYRLRRLLLAFPEGADDAVRQALRDEAQALVEQVASGQDFVEMVGMRSDDASTKDKGGAIGTVRPVDLSPAFAQALKVTEVGQAAAIETPLGMILLYVEGRVEKNLPSFEESRGLLSQQLYEERMERELDLWATEERRRAHIDVFADGTGDQP